MLIAMPNSIYGTRLKEIRYRNADTLKYATVEDSLGRVHGVRGGKFSLRFVASDATMLSSSIWLLLELLCISHAMRFI